jgi:hypothetical protein
MSASFVKSSTPRTAVEVVFEAVGHFTHPDGWSDGKTRMWVLNDKTVVAYVGAPNGSTIRHVFPVNYVLKRGKGIEIQFTDGRMGGLSIKPCACGFGAVANAGPIDDRYSIKWIRPAPEWFINR